jgi:putative endonuclease
MAKPHDFGRQCEQLAAELLATNGWTILARNYRFGHKEIDIVAARDATVIFVEVKGRRGRDWGHPLEAITARKRSEIEHVARQWVARYGTPGLLYRFDAIAIVDAGSQTRVEHIEDAWRL